MPSDHAPVSRGSVYMAEYHVKDREVLFRECDETGNLNISFFFKIKTPQPDLECFPYLVLKPVFFLTFLLYDKEPFGFFILILSL